MQASDRAEAEEAMHHIVGNLKRLPAHWVEQRAHWHRQLNSLLDQWETLALEEMLSDGPPIR